MADEKELMLHRCAIFATSVKRASYEATLDYLKETILQAIADGYVTFITTAKDGYELDAAKFLCELKKNSPQIHLVIAQPYVNQGRNSTSVRHFQEICSRADLIKYISIKADPNAQARTNEWVVNRCNRIICTTNGPYATLNRLRDIDLAEKEVVNVSMTWSKKQKKFIRAETIEKKEKRKAAFPENLLTDVLDYGNEIPEDVLNGFPEDIETRIFELVSRYGVRNEKIIRMRYCDEMTLQQIGDHFGVSHERIRQIIGRTLKRLRFPSNMAFLRNEELPANNQQKWSDEESKQLLEEFRTNLKLSEIAEGHGRTEGAIIARLAVLTGLERAEIREKYHYVKLDSPISRD